MSKQISVHKEDDYGSRVSRETREYLRRIRELQSKADQLKKEIDEVLENISQIKGLSYDHDKVVRTGSRDQTGDTVIRLENSVNRYIATMTDYANMRDDIVKQIQAVEDVRYMNILYKRYVECKSYETIGKEMTYRDDYIRRLHTEALVYFYEKVLQGDLTE